jgi:DNA polymerase-3 subunit beta
MEETRYYLNGIYLHPATQGGQPTLRAVATDGHRLAQAELPLPAGADGMPGIILPRKTVNELHRLIESSETMVGLDISASKARFRIGTDKEIGGVTLTTKLIDGTFPDYARVIPKANDRSLKVRNTEFIAAVDRVSTIASDRGRPVKLNIDDGTLVLSVNNPEGGGSATEQIGADYGAEPLEIGFNARYLLDIANQIESETAQFLLSDAGSPTVVKDQSDEGALYVLMPMRV